MADNVALTFDTETVPMLHWPLGTKKITERPAVVFGRGGAGRSGSPYRVPPLFLYKEADMATVRKTIRVPIRRQVRVRRTVRTTVRRSGKVRVTVRR